LKFFGKGAHPSRGGFVPIDDGLLARSRSSFEIIPEESPTMNILMAVRTEVFPVASIRRVVVMISVPVMDRQQVPVRGIELAAATAANQSVQGQ
jgi:hypothetical protein